MSLAELSPTAVHLSNGVELHYVRQGSGLTAIFIHGAMGDWRSWEQQWDAFTEHFDCISYSRRYSFPNGNRMPSPDHGAFVDAEDLLGFMDALEIKKAILIGSSYGAFTALAVASLAPDRVAAIAGVEPPMMRYAQMDPEGAEVAEQFLVSTARPAREAFQRGDDEAGATILTDGITAGRKRRGPLPEALMKSRMQNMLAAKMLALSSDEFPLIEPAKLTGLTMPVLLMSGGNTAPVHAAIFKNVVRHMPQAKTLIVDGSGHSVSRQQPEIFNREVLDFLSGSLAVA